MTAQLIDGKKVSEKCLVTVRECVDARVARG